MQAKDDSTRNGHGELPAIDEDDWFAGAVALVIITVILAGFGAAWILASPDTAEMKLRSELMSPFGAGFLALITFCTVAWRGMVTSRQANEQRRQNNAAETTSYDKLLVDGAQLLSEAARPKRIAGVAALQAVIDDPKHHRTQQAMDILGDFYDLKNATAGNRILNAVAKALSQGAAGGYSANVRPTFQRSKSITEEKSWRGVSGFAVQIYEGGFFSGTEFAKLAGKHIQFSNVHFRNCEINDLMSYARGCTFYGCTINRLALDALSTNTFQLCNFSHCTFEAAVANLKVFNDRKLRDGRNFYLAGQPPKVDFVLGQDRIPDWKVVFNEHG